MHTAFSKKQYDLLASSIKDSVNSFVMQARYSNVEREKLTDRLDTLQRVTITICVILAFDNPQFDTSKFIEACGLKEVTIDDVSFKWQW